MKMFISLSSKRIVFNSKLQGKNVKYMYQGSLFQNSLKRVLQAENTKTYFVQELAYHLLLK